VDARAGWAAGPLAVTVPRPAATAVVLAVALVAVLAVVGLLLARRWVARRSASAVAAAAHRADLRLAHAAELDGRRLAALTQHTDDLVLVLDASSRVAFVNAACERVLGRPVRGVQGRLVALLTAPEHARTLEQSLRGTAPGEVCRVELVLQRGDGTPVQTTTTVDNRTEDPAVEGFVLTVRDVTAEREQAQELARHVLRDPVTGLANRRLFTERLVQALVGRPGHEDSLVVMVCDLDDFKAVNDQHGHAVGDELLALVGRALSAVLGPGDTAARLGGDEFAVLLEGRTGEQAQEVAHRIVRALSQPVRLGALSVDARVSVGLAQGRPGRSTAEEMLREADVAMYWAKDRGRSTVAVYDPVEHEQAVDRLVLRSDLQRAIRTGELRLVYQPTVDLGTGLVSGVEALVRWHHPLRGAVPPSEFVPVAEASGMIGALGAWVLMQACQVGAELQRSDAAPTMAVNISPVQLGQPDFVVELLAALDQSGLAPDRLVLEITETAVLTDIDRVVPRLAALRTLGVRVAVDDFGTGYSSLSYLSRLPLDVLKIDKSFVDRVLVDTQGASVAQAVLDMSNSLGLVTVAEGVEQPEQARWLREAGCRLGQGYLWSRPVEQEDLAAVLAAHAGGTLTLDGRTGGVADLRTAPRADRPR
jgi:diguanylate cyclase (GGDEF)-like protein/PAS domain S-box-containing protein